MLIYILAVWIAVGIEGGVDAVCSASRINCKSNNTYSFCVDLGYTTVKLESVELKCPNGLFCTEKRYYPCVPESEIPPTGGLPELVTSTTTTLPVIVTSIQTHATSPSPITQPPPEITSSSFVPSTNAPLIPSTGSIPTVTSTPVIQTTAPVTSKTLIPSATDFPTNPTTIILTTLDSATNASSIPSTQYTSTNPPAQITQTTTVVPLTTIPSTQIPLIPSTKPQVSDLPATHPTTILPTFTTISIINSTTTAVPPTTYPSTTLIPSSNKPPIASSTIIPSTQSQSVTSEDIKTPVVTTTAPVVTESSSIATTKEPTLPPCPDPLPSGKPVCRISGATYPGPVCTRYYECVPIWLRLEPEEKICTRGKAYSASQKKCVTPPIGCVCVN